jgi:hypothetical protein
MIFTLPAAVRLAESLSSTIEEAVTRFPRKHRYAFGAELRERAWSVLSTANLAALRPERRSALLEELRDKVDDLKLSLQLGKQMRAFVSFRQFEALYRDAAKLGQQVGGWHRSVSHPQGQSAQAVVHGQSANTLSARSASIGEANA